MDNYRRPMYTRNRTGSYQGQQQCGCGYTPVMEAAKGDCQDKRNLSNAHDYCDKHEEKCIDKLPLAMAYVPFQKWKNIYDVSTGLQTGTIFQDLNLPFYGYKMCGMRGDRYDK
ncbi:MAG: spore coat associated protein CotJA [Anaerocolumna sp.]